MKKTVLEENKDNSCIYLTKPVIYIQSTSSILLKSKRYIPLLQGDYIRPHSDIELAIQIPFLPKPILKL